MTTDAIRCPVLGCKGKLVPMKPWQPAPHRIPFESVGNVWQCDSPFCVYWKTRPAETPPDAQHTILQQE